MSDILSGIFSGMTMRTGQGQRSAAYSKLKISDATFQFLLFYLSKIPGTSAASADVVCKHRRGDERESIAGGCGFYRMLERMEKKTGIHTTPHMLRRYFGNMRRDAGWPLEMISEAYGHKHTDTTIKYLNIVDDQLMEASDQYYAKHSVLYDVEKLL